MPLLSLAHFTIIKAGPVELIECAARAGYDAVGLRLQPPLPGDTIVPVVMPSARKTRPMMSDWYDARKSLTVTMCTPRPAMALR